MTEFNPVELISKVERMRGKVLASHCACKIAFARDLHGKLLEKLDAMVAALHSEIDTECELAAHKGTPDGEAWYELYYICTSFERRWIESGPISLLDSILEFVIAEGEGEGCLAGLDYTEVPARELEGLSEIMDEIARGTGVRFIAARV
ncbi:hypothetical protein ADU59_00245 (plasmid) [Pararhizobium polonicum]|uniref:Uncharacterized protein n=1 Tax=Pararhizobium polonicum TaxID=1612624 RepID=A0A1C7P8A3_9HYPH|nr:hypothetical protein [Pararhizobium polonicum]OBZ97492.1 hypothetical protein ADU59_00245 [Pararhizobium polonicum]